MILPISKAELDTMTPAISNIGIVRRIENVIPTSIIVAMVIGIVLPLFTIIDL